jgi:hypothetical protein
MIARPYTHSLPVKQRYRTQAWAPGGQEIRGLDAAPQLSDKRLGTFSKRCWMFIEQLDSIGECYLIG